MKVEQAMTTGCAGVPALLVLESYPASMQTTGPALPTGSPQFRTACRRWRLSAEVLSAVPRMNALESDCVFKQPSRVFWNARRH